MKAYIESVKKHFTYYKEIGEKAIAQVEDEQLYLKPSSESNSIAIIVNHLYGNMLSRWTNFFSEDGEKEWRNRDAEFEEIFDSREELLSKWNEGWNTLFKIVNDLSVEDLMKTITIRGERHSVLDSVNRQLTHYSYHVGEIVYIAKIYRNEHWKSLTIPKGKSQDYNLRMKNK